MGSCHRGPPLPTAHGGCQQHHQVHGSRRLLHGLHELGGELVRSGIVTL